MPAVSPGLLTFKALRCIGRIWLPAGVGRRLDSIGFYEYTMRQLTPSLSPVSVRAVLGLAPVWPQDQESLRQTDIEAGMARLSRPPVTATH
jgi:hypothetical protein